MASSLIHMCVAKKIGDRLGITNNELLLGSIAPDLSKHLGENKVKSHFLDNVTTDIPNLSKFLNKYKLDNNFLIGYYIHLYTDKLWFDCFLDKLVLNDNIRLVDGTIIKTSEDEIKNLIYNDYTNLNIQLIDYYNLDLSLFYRETVVPKVSFDEIDMNKLYLLVEKAGIILEECSKTKSYLFDIYSVNEFIDNCSNEIYKDILDKKIL